MAKVRTARCASRRFWLGSRSSARVLVAFTFALASCQSATEIRIANACDVAIEADVSDVRDPVDHGYGHDWKSVASGASEYMGSTSEASEAVFVWVRAVGSESVPEPLREVINPTGRSQDAEDVVTITIPPEECPRP
jgi:hypothetical protein